MCKLALFGGQPVRERLLPYSRQSIDQSDEGQVLSVLRSAWLTTGPKIGAFEDQFAERTGVRHAVALSSGTAALHACLHSLGLGSGDEVILPSISFAATANAVLYQRAKPVFAEVSQETLLIDTTDVENKLTEKTKAVIAVDYAGQPCSYEALRAIADNKHLALIADACHSLGATYQDRPVGTLADCSCFSFHPVKLITTGEGGMVTTNDTALADRIRSFRNHGFSKDHLERARENTWYYEMTDLGHNYRITDLQCALGLSQLPRMLAFIERRRGIARLYDLALEEITAVKPLGKEPERTHAYHLYVVRLELDQLNADRDLVLKALRAEGVGANVHYMPIYLHPYYMEHSGGRPGLCPRSEKVFESLLSLPIFPGMRDHDVDDVVEALKKVVRAFAR